MTKPRNLPDPGLYDSLAYNSLSHSSIRSVLHESLQFDFSLEKDSILSILVSP